MSPTSDCKLLHTRNNSLSQTAQRAESRRRRGRLRNGTAMGSESVGKISRPERKLILGGSASRTLRNSLVTSCEVTHATTSARFGKWLVGAIQSPNGGMSYSGRVAISLAGEQFWGRAVQASRDSLDPGRFLFPGSFPKEPRVSISRRFGWRPKNYLPGSSENIGVSSLFPDDKLR
jgi:hypothetical protein